MGLLSRRPRITDSDPTVATVTIGPRGVSDVTPGMPVDPPPSVLHYASSHDTPRAVCEPADLCYTYTTEVRSVTCVDCLGELDKRRRAEAVAKAWAEQPPKPLNVQTRVLPSHLADVRSPTITRPLCGAVAPRDGVGMVMVPSASMVTCDDCLDLMGVPSFAASSTASMAVTGGASWPDVDEDPDTPWPVVPSGPEQAVMDRMDLLEGSIDHIGERFDALQAAVERLSDRLMPELPDAADLAAIITEFGHDPDLAAEIILGQSNSPGS